MQNQRNRNADRGVSDKPIALRLPKPVMEQAKELAKKEGVSLNRHATQVYLRGIAVPDSNSKSEITNA